MTNLPTITIKLATAAMADMRALITELDEILSADYSPEQRHGLQLNAIFQPHIRLFVARVDGVAVGYAGVALLADFAEVKRMCVREHARGRGVAQALLERPETEAGDAGLDVLRLETGDGQRAAMRFYERSGFRRCGVFGHHVEMPPASIATSVLHEKRINA